MDENLTPQLQGEHETNRHEAGRQRLYRMIPIASVAGGLAVGIGVAVEVSPVWGIISGFGFTRAGVWVYLRTRTTRPYGPYANNMSTLPTYEEFPESRQQY